MTLERSLLERDLSNIEEALDEADALLSCVNRVNTAEAGDGQPFCEALDCLATARRELKAFRERWAKGAAA